MQTSNFKLNADTQNHPDRTGSFWPTPHQELLLRAALLPPAAASVAWGQWCAEVDIEEDHLDLGSFRLLPLVYHNLRKTIPNDPLMGRLRGIHHRTWVETQIHIQACSAVLRRFQEAGIETLLLKGMPLALAYYPGQGTRPMGDFDLLVPKAQVYTAISLLTELGWKPIDRPVHALTETYLQIRHAQGFADDKGHNLDLHWRVLNNALDGDIDVEFWHRSAPLQTDLISSRALNPTDLLLHVCVHGMAWAPVPPVRWVADAVMILRKSEGEIDWQRLINLAERSQTTLPLSTALNYLRSYAVSVPEEVLQTLEHLPVSSQAQMLFAASTQRTKLFGQLPVLWARYQMHQMRHRTWPRGLSGLGFPAFIAAYYNRHNAYEMIEWFVTRVIRRTTVSLSSLKHDKKTR